MENSLVGSFTQEAISPKLKTGRIALWDFDYVKHNVAAKIYKDVQKIKRGELDIFIKEDPVIKYTREYLSEILTKVDDPIIFCFSAPSIKTFRCSISFEKQYKGNRKKDYTDYDGKIRDMFSAMKYVQDNFVTLITDNLEADDIVSMLQDPDNTYIASKDKDMKTIPGWHYNWSLNIIEQITPEKALYNLAKQLLTGDTTDNITGLPGCGEVGADKILQEVQNPKYYIKAVMHAYQMKFGVFKGTDMFAENWMLIKMRENRGKHFLEQHQRMFDLKEMLLNQIKLKK